MLSILSFILCIPKSLAVLDEDLEVLAAQNEPRPWCGVSYQEDTPFRPIMLSPEAFMENIASVDNVEEANDYFQCIGLPTDSSEYTYFYKHSMQCERFALESNLSGIEKISVVICSYDPSTYDNVAFLFIHNEDDCFLIDVIASFGDIQLVQSKDNIWLVGRTGTEYQTVRWYHVNSQRIVLSYLAQGYMADRVDYHFHVKSCVDPALNQCFFDHNTLLILKQFSIDDFTQVGFTDVGIMRVLYTQSITYQAQNDGTFLLTDTIRYDGLDIEAVKRLLLQ